MEKYNFDLHLRYSQACRDANPQVFKCGKCGEVFTTLINLQQHIRRHEQNNHPTSTYSSSQKVSNSSTSQTPMPAGLSQFEFSDESFTQNEDLQEHLQTHKVGRPRKSQHCNEMHVKTHNGKKLYKYQYCSIPIRHRSALKCHQRTHTEKSPLQCQYCTKALATTASLKSHMRMHTGEKPYSCKHCGKSLSSYSGLQCHLRTHSGDKPYQCQYCQKQFIVHSSLIVHLRVHTGE